MLICDDFQLVNQFSERNDNSHKEIITFEIHEVVAQWQALAASGRDEIRLESRILLMDWQREERDRKETLCRRISPKPSVQ